MANSHPPSDQSFDPAVIKTLADLLNETHLTEIEVRFGELHVRVAKSPVPVSTVHTVSSPVVQMAPSGQAAESVLQPEISPSSIENHPGLVRSPMVGTAYRAPAPGARPFVEEGDEVKEGQPLLIIEAMKTMNSIAAPRSGRIKQILVGDAQPVEYDEPLLILE